jgi:acetyl esterase/lipase
MRYLLLLWMLVSLTACHQAYFGVINAGADAPLVRYQTRMYDEHHQLSLDVYRARDSVAPAPMIVFFYGGTWRYGQREWYRFVGESLADAGFVVVVADYRTAPDVSFPAFLEDAARATAYAFQHAAQFGADPKAMFLMGHSAGGHIAAMLATDARWLHAVGLKPTDFRGMIGVAGPYDFLPIWNPRMLQVFPDQTQPINFVDGDEPPMLLIRGKRDIIIQPRHHQHMAAKLGALGITVETVEYEGVGHAEILTAIARDRDDQAPTRADVIRFITQQMAATPDDGTTSSATGR